ncbi:MAG: PspC domain-containing protein [Actinomycetota bacterium]
MNGASTDVRRLTRRRDGKLIWGVASGLGEYFHTDPVWFRLGFIVAAFMGGAGVIAYLVLAAILPADDSKAPTPLEQGAERAAHALRGTPAWIGVALIVIGGLLAVSQVVDWRPGVFWGLALIILGIAFFRRQADRDAEPPSPAVAATPAPNAPALEQPAVTEPIPPTTDVARATPPPPRAQRDRSGLGLLTIGAVMVALGGAALLDYSGALHVRLVHYFALALAVLGVGMLVGAWWGRARWLIVPSILLIPFVLVASLVHVPFTGGTGNHLVRPASAASVHPQYHIAAGRLEIDLRQIAGVQPVQLKATAVAGRLLVRVPRNAALTVRARVGGG